MALVHFSKEGFEKAVSSGQLVVADFWAPWCGPCRMLAPVMEQLEQKYGDKAVLGKVNVDEEPNLAAAHGVMSIPTVILFKDGREVERQVGLMPGGDPAARFGALLEKYL